MAGVDILVYVGYAIMAAGFVYGMYMMSKAGGDMENLDPSTLDDFNITKADEGSVVPLVYGRRKVTGNIIWYGNLTTEPIYEKVDTGKDDEWVVTGYNYFLDIWQSLGHGDMTIIETYINAELKDVEYTSTVFNSGHDGVFSTIPGEYATSLDGVCTVFYEAMLLGENVQTVPTVHYVVERLMDNDNPVSYKNMSNGINPAAIVYDLLRRGGAGSGDIDLASFNSAAEYWNDKGYGLNVVFTNKPKTRDAIKQILQYVGAAFGQDDEGKFYLNALDENDTSAATISYEDGDITSFSFERQTWDKLHTDFVATYIDEDKEYTERTVKAYNPAVARILGRRVENSVKLQGFRDLNTTSKRVWEIMKEGTYPFANVQLTVPIKFYELKLGSVISLYHSKYGISNAAFRVMKKTIKGQEENSIALTLRQKTEELYDSNWTVIGGSAWANPDYSPSAAYAKRIWQLPYNHITGTDTSYLVLVARTGTFETGYAIYKSFDDSDFTPAKIGTKFSQYGILDSTYPITYEIDETVGLTYTPYQEDPSFDTISIESAMQMPRMALVEDELIGFATVTLNGDGSITLTDCIRGMLGTAITSHSSGVAVWLFSVDNGIIYKTEDSSFYYKIAPYSLRGSVDVSTIPSTEVTRSATKSYPSAPILYIEDNVTDLKVTFYGHFFNTTGAGMMGENNPSTDIIPEGRIGWRVGTGTPTYETTNPFYVTRTTSTMYFWFEKDGISSAEIGFSVSYASLPRYYGAEIPDSNSGLMKISYGQQNFLSMIDYNALTMESLLKVSGLLDIDLTGLSDEDYLMFDAITSKFLPVSYNTMMHPISFLNFPTLEGEHGPYDDGSITASSFQASYPPQHSWDGGDGNLYPQWIITDPGSEVFPDVTESHWIQWDWTDHGGSRDLRGIRLYTRYNATTDRWPSAVKVYGSNTGSFSGEESLLFDGELLNATSIYPNNWTGWTEFTETENFDFYIHHRVVVTDVYTYDSGSHWFAVDQWQFKEALSWEYVSDFQVYAGSTYDTIDDMYYYDAEEVTILGVDSSTPLDVSFTFINVEESTVYFNILGRYEGTNGKIVKAYAYNTDTLEWDALTQNTSDMENRTTESIYSFYADTIYYADLNDTMKFRVKVETAGDENDKFVITKACLSSPDPHPYWDLVGGFDQENMSDDSNIWVSDWGLVVNRNSTETLSIFGIPSISTGDKVYWEVTLDTLNTSTNAVGVCAESNFPPIGTGIWSYTYSWCFTTNYCRYYHSSYTSTGTPYCTNGDTVSIAVDFDAGHYWARVNGGAWRLSGDPTTDTNPSPYGNINQYGPLRPAFTLYGTNKWTVRFRASNQLYSAPAGFTPLVDDLGSGTSTTT